MAAVIATSSTPNPDAMKFTLDVTVPAMVNVTDPADAGGDPFAEAVFAIDGVAALFAVNDFVTITRRAGAPWDPIVEAVSSAVAAHL